MLFCIKPADILMSTRGEAIFTQKYPESLTIECTLTLPLQCS